MPAERKRILVIDDDPDMHAALRLILEPAGYQVTCCTTGPEGLATMRRDPPDLLLLDIMLATPTEGFHLAHEMRHDGRLQSVPIIMISALGESMERECGEEIGNGSLRVERFIDKPFQAATILNAVNAILAAGPGAGGQAAAGER